jgi:hypothetical protein
VQYCTTPLSSTNVPSTKVLTSCPSLILCIYYRLSYLRICLHMEMLTHVISDYSTHIFKNIGSILSCVSMLAGSQGGKLTNPHLHIYLHIMSPTNLHSFAYLANFMNAGSQIGTIKLGVYILHPVGIRSHSWIACRSRARRPSV